MSERKIEQKLIKAVKKRKGLCLKFVSPGFVGVPDRIILFRGGIIAFVEIKDTGKKLRPIQARRIKQLKNLGFKVYVVDNIERIEEVLNAIQSS